MMATRLIIPWHLLSSSKPHSAQRVFFFIFFFFILVSMKWCCKYPKTIYEKHMAGFKAWMPECPSFILYTFRFIFFCLLFFGIICPCQRKRHSFIHCEATILLGYSTSYQNTNKQKELFFCVGGMKNLTQSKHWRKKISSSSNNNGKNHMRLSACAKWISMWLRNTQRPPRRVRHCVSTAVCVSVA